MTPSGTAIGVRDDEPATAAVRPATELEKALGDGQVRPREAVRGGRLEVAVLPQVDGDALDVEQLRDLVDGDLERVRERQLRVRLRNEREQRPRSLELERGLAAPARDAQRVSGARGERPQLVEHGRARRTAGEAELERGLRRLADRQRHQSVSDHGRARQRLVGARRVGLEDAVRSDRLHRLAIPSPEGGARRARGRHGQPDDLVLRALVLRAGRKCLTGELDETGAVEDVGDAVAESAHRHRRVCRGGGDDHALLRVERRPPAVDLDRADQPVSGPDRRHEQRSGADARSGREDRVGDGTVAVELLRRDAVGAHPRSLELRRECARSGSDAARTGTSLRIDDPHHDEGRAEGVGDRIGHRAERRPERVPVRDGGADPRQGSQRRDRRPMLGQLHLRRIVPRLRRMAQPARQPRRDAPPPVDPSAVQRNYRRERAKRRARVERSWERQLAAFRFVSVLLFLVAVAALLVLTIWNQIENLFGL
jgi:hypothetical protein